jgi:hypothetical protein
MSPQTPEYQDPTIQVDRATGKMIGEVVCEEIKKSLAANDKTYQLAKRCQNQYNQVTRWMETGKEVTVPWKGAADYFIPLTEWVVDAVHARVLNTLFSQEPYMEATGVESSDVDRAPGVTDFLDMVFREKIKLYDNTNFFWKQMLTNPFAVLKYDVVKEYDRIISKQPALVFINPATGDQQQLLKDDPEIEMKLQEMIQSGYQPSGENEVWVSEDKAIIDGPQLKYVRFEDYIYCPNAKRDTRLYWEGDRFWLTLNEMNLKAMQEKFIKESVDMVKRSLDLSSISGSEKVIAQRSQLRECFHWYGRFPFNKNNEVDFNDPEAIEQEVYCVVDYKEKELLQIMRWYHRRLPYPDRCYIRGEFEETEEFIGRSLAMKLYMTQKELNSLHNTIMNNAWIAMQKIFVKKKTLQGSEWDKPEVYPGVMWEEDMTGDIRVLEVGDVKAIGMEMESTLLNFAERISNISIFQTGTARQEGGNKTLGEVNKTISEGNQGLDKFIQRCHNILKKVCTWTVDYYFEHMPEGLERRIRGDQGDLIFPSQENAALYQEKGIGQQWQKDDLAGQFDFVWNGTSLNSSKEWNLVVANDLMDRFLPQPMIAQSMLYTWEILKTNLTARKIKDWQKYIPKKEAIVAAMQQMEAEAQARTAMGPMAPPDGAGMPPQPMGGPQNAGV